MKKSFTQLLNQHWSHSWIKENMMNSFERLELLQNGPSINEIIQLHNLNEEGKVQSILSYFYVIL
jgi:hypothetical protein